MSHWRWTNWLLLVLSLGTGLLLAIALGYTILEALSDLADILLGDGHDGVSGVPTGSPIFYALFLRMAIRRMFW